MRRSLGTICVLATKERIMSNTRVSALDHPIEETNVWLTGVEEELELDDRQRACNALRAMHA